jgi:hypothetical protein
MAPKSEKVHKKISEAASVSEGASNRAPPSVLVVAGEDDTLSTSASVHSDAAGSSDVPAPPSAPSSLPPTAIATRTIAPAESDARRLDVVNLALRFNSAESALSDGLIGRKSLEIENDDFEHEKSDGRPKYWVKRFMEAFAKDYLGEPEDTKKNSPEQKAWYARWQNQAHVGVVGIFKMKDQSHLEKCCWYLFDSIIKSHELGVFTMVANDWSPSKLKCSKHLAATVTIIEKYAPVRLDLLRLWHIEEVAANPEAFIKRKLVNCWNNGNRAERNAKRKNAAKSKNSAKAAEQEVEEEAEVEEDTEAQTSADAEEASEPHVASPLKETQPTTVGGTVKGGDKVKAKGKNTKRARSATPEPRDTEANKKPVTTRRRPAGKKTPVAAGTKGRGSGKDASAGAEAEPTV